MDRPDTVLDAPAAPRRLHGRRFWGAWALTFALTALLVGLATLPPLLDAGPRAFLMRVFAGLCHQIPERSPHLHGVALAVCHRCYGIYGGLPLAAGAFLLLRPWEARIARAGRFLVPAAVVPPGVDWLGDIVGLWTNTPVSRFATGALFGVIAGFFLTRALVELFSPRPRLHPTSAPPGSGGPLPG